MAYCALFFKARPHRPRHTGRARLLRFHDRIHPPPRPLSHALCMTPSHSRRRPYGPRCLKYLLLGPLQEKLAIKLKSFPLCVFFWEHQICRILQKLHSQIRECRFPLSIHSGLTSTHRAQCCRCRGVKESVNLLIFLLILTEGYFSIDF